MLTTSSKTDLIIYLFQKRIDHINYRIKAIKNSYKQINNMNLKNRLIKEYENLEIKFFEIKSLVKLINQSKPEKLTISKLLLEKCCRYEKDLFTNKYLFSV